MPLDFRYHLASLTAVFVALIIGILLGVAMTGAPGLSSQIETLREEFTRSQVLKDIEDRTDQFNRRTLPMLVRNRMFGRNVILVQNVLTFPDEKKAAVRDALEQAGAAVTAEVMLKPALLQITPEQIERLYMRSNVPAQNRKATMDGLMRALAGDLGNGLNGITPAMEKEKLLVVRGDISLPISTVVLLGGGIEPARNIAKTLDMPLLEACSQRRLRVAATEAFDTPQSVIPLYRKAVPITVDNVDYAAGRIALILTLSAPDLRGHYGYKATADDVMPDIEL